MQLHVAQNHSDAAVLEHTSELVSQLASLGIQPSPDDDGDEDEWEGIDSSDEDGDVVMTGPSAATQRRREYTASMVCLMTIYSAWSMLTRK